MRDSTRTTCRHRSARAADHDSRDTFKSIRRLRVIRFIRVPNDHGRFRRATLAGQLRLTDSIDRVTARLEHRFQNGGRFRQTVHDQNARRVAYHDACLPCLAIAAGAAARLTILRDQPHPAKRCGTIAMRTNRVKTNSTSRPIWCAKRSWRRSHERSCFAPARQSNNERPSILERFPLLLRLAGARRPRCQNRCHTRPIWVGGDVVDLVTRPIGSRRFPGASVSDIRWPGSLLCPKPMRCSSS